MITSFKTPLVLNEKPTACPDCGGGSVASVLRDGGSRVYCTACQRSQSETRRLVLALERQSMSARDMSGCTLVCHAPNATRCDREHADKHLHLHRCTAYKNHCGTHGFIHGGEAEELRSGIEDILRQWRLGYLKKGATILRIGMLLDEVDARDSLAFREFREATDEPEAW